jgi:hypothetical protein
LKNNLEKEQSSWTDHVKKEINNYCKEPKSERNVIHKIKRKKFSWIGHILSMNGLLHRVIEIQIEGMGSRERRSKQLLNELKDFERGNSLLHCVNNALWKSPWSCRKTNFCLMMTFPELAAVFCT